MRVFIYWNLRRKCFSVKALEGEHKGHVVAHVYYFEVTSAVFKVSEAGRQRVLREKRKNVHAGVVGGWSPNSDHYNGEVRRPVMYNPYKGGAFVAFDGAAWQPVASARLVTGYYDGTTPRLHAVEVR